MAIPFTTRVALKIKRTIRELNPAEREFGRVRPLINQIPGLLYGDEDKWLFRTARSLPDSANLVEVGSYKGRSTCCLAFGCQGSKKRVFAVDSFNGNEWDFNERGFFQEFWQNIERCSLSQYVEAVVGLSSEVAKTWNKPIHFLFIDGSHRYEDVLVDFAGFSPHVVAGGIVAFHDVNEYWPGVLKAWHETIKHQLRDTGVCGCINYGRKPKTSALFI
jgi:predicted O-methyltransferase YrrM